MVNNNNLIMETTKPVGDCLRIKNCEHEITSFEEFMKAYQEEEGIIDSYNFEVDSYRDIGIGKRSGPMPFRSDETTLMINFSSKSNHWLYRGLFRYENGTINETLELKGLGEMRKALQNLENGKLRVVRNASDGNSIKYEPIECREEELKNKLREMIGSLESDNTYYDENVAFKSESYSGVCMQH